MAKKAFTKPTKSSSSSFLSCFQWCNRSSERNAALYNIVASDDGAAPALSNKPAKASAAAYLCLLFRSCFPYCFESRNPEVDSNDDTASDCSILPAASDNKPANTSPTKATEASSASFKRSSISSCFKSCSSPEVNSPNDAISVGSHYSLASNRSATISPARAALRREKVVTDSIKPLSPEARTASIASSISLGRRGSDSSSDDEVGARARGGVITTHACVHRVDEDCSSELAVRV